MYVGELLRIVSTVTIQFLNGFASWLSFPVHLRNPTRVDSLGVAKYRDNLVWSGPVQFRVSFIFACPGFPLLSRFLIFLVRSGLVRSGFEQKSGPGFSCFRSGPVRVSFNLVLLVFLHLFMNGLLHWNLASGVS